MAAFAHWIRGLGDNRGHTVFSAEFIQKFELDYESVYYLTSVRDVSKRTNAVRVELGISIYVASAIEMAELKDDVLPQTFRHSVIKLAAADWGIWVDGFAHVSVLFLTVAI